MSEPVFDEQLTKPVREYVEKAREQAEALVARKEELSDDMDASILSEHLKIYESYARYISHAGSLASANFDVDQKSEEANQLVSYVTQESTKISETLLYFGLTIKGWGEERINKYAEQIEYFRPWLVSVAKSARYALSEAEERIISRKDANGGSVIDKIFGMITSAYEFELEVEEETLTLTQEELTPYRVSEDREMRRKATQALIKPYKQDKHVLTEIFSALVKDHDDEAQLRGFEKPIDTRHHQNEISAKVYEALLASSKKHLGVFNEYLKLKQEYLQIEDFRYYDLSAPVKGLPEGLPYEEAKKLVLEVFGSYADWFKDAANKVFEQDRVDAKARKNKRGGACCYAVVPGELPLVILNHTSTYDALRTMAHEFGHAVHDVVAADNSPLYFHPPIVLAETASTLAEHLMFERSLKDADKQAQTALIFSYLDDIFKTSVWQLKYVEFEKYAHGAIQEGATPTDLTKKWKEIGEEFFWAMTPDESDVERWYAIPHIFSMPFYCYGYCFGVLLALSLSEKATPEQVKEILASGGSVEPEELLSRYGFDLASEEFWDAAYKIVESLVDRLKSLI